MSDHTPRTENLQVMNDYLVERGVHEPDYPAGAAYGLLPGSDAEPLVNLVDVDGYLDEGNPAVAKLIAAAKAEAWDEGRRAEQEWRHRQDDADAAGQYVQINYPRNPYKGRANCGCDLTGTLPPAIHVVDKHDTDEDHQ